MFDWTIVRGAKESLQKVSSAAMEPEAIELTFSDRFYTKGEVLP